MTEEEWFAAHERELPRAIMGWSTRRQRLLAVAVCRAFGKSIDYPAAHAALETAEHFAETGKSKAALRRARQSIVALRNQLFFDRQPGAPLIDGGVELALFVIQVAASENAVSGTVPQALEALVIFQGIPDRAARERLYPAYREIAGPPVMPKFSPKWRTDTAVTLARQMYDSRDFGAMPILADALQDAGCENADILNHCRGEALHARGCWVVDLVLGRS